MIYLITGTPGSGKTLYALSTLIPSLMKEEKRRVVACGIPGLLIDHEPVDVDRLRTWPDWVKAGDVVVVDEVQSIYRPRSLGTTPPPDVQALETHRHLGVDFVFITQHPMLLDQNIRRLVGCHIHVRRIFGGHSAVVYEWDACQSDPARSLGSARKRPFRYDKKTFGLYTSADKHTKPATKVPAVVFVPVLALAGLAVALPLAISRGDGMLRGRAVASSAPSADLGAQASSPPASSSPAPSSSASVPVTLQASASQAQKPPASTVAGCVYTATRCSCYDRAGYVLQLSDVECRAAVTALGSVIPIL